MSAGTVYVEQSRVLWFAAPDDTPTDLDSITAAELADAFDVTSYVIEARHGMNEQLVDDGDFLDAFQPDSIGTYKNQPSLTLRKKLRGAAPGEGEEAIETFTRGATGTLVFFETLDKGVAPGTGASYKAYPNCECGEPQDGDWVKNESARFVTNFACGSAPVRGTVVAS